MKEHQKAQPPKGARPGMSVVKFDETELHRLAVDEDVGVMRRIEHVFGCIVDEVIEGNQSQ